MGALGWLAWLVLGAAVAVRHLSNIFKVSLLGGCVQLLLPLPFAWGAKLWAFLSVLLAVTMTFWGGYPLAERLCKILVAVMTASLALAAFLSHPDPGALTRALLIPSLPAHQGAFPALLLVMVLIGTEAGSLTNLTYTYFLNAKDWKTGGRLAPAENRSVLAHRLHPDTRNHGPDCGSRCRASPSTTVL